MNKADIIIENGSVLTMDPDRPRAEAVAIAGGFTARARQRYIVITRTVNGKVITGKVPITSPIRPGDTIHVRERLF